MINSFLKKTKKYDILDLIDKTILDLTEKKNTLY